MPLYKDDFTDFIMTRSKANPRVGHLARTALSYYLGDLYNPKTFDMDVELSFRSYIRACVKEKIEKSEPYDWLLIDYVFRHILERAEITILPEDALAQKKKNLRRKNPIFYKDDLTDKLMHENSNFPRYRHLARKAISHYLGDLYNPEIFDPNIELFLRQCIRDYVEMKVVEKIPYDWVVIDNFFKKILFDYGYTHLEFNMSALQNGYQGVIRSGRVAN